MLSSVRCRHSHFSFLPSAFYLQNGVDVRVRESALGTVVMAAVCLCLDVSISSLVQVLMVGLTLRVVLVVKVYNREAQEDTSKL